MGSVVSLGAYKASLSNVCPRLYQPGKSIVGSRVVAPGSAWRHTQRNVPYTLVSRLLDKIIILGGVEARRTISVASSWLLAQILPVGSAIRLHLSATSGSSSIFLIQASWPQVRHSRLQRQRLPHLYCAVYAFHSLIKQRKSWILFVSQYSNKT